MKLKIQLLFAVLSYLLLPYTGHGQELTRKQMRKQRPKYIQVGVGINRGTLRDFATSPITYKGMLANVSLGSLKMDTLRETRFITRFNSGVYDYKRTDGITVKSKAAQYILFLKYYKLYRIGALSNRKWNVKAGGMADINTDLRINPDFMNAAYGYEVFGTLSLSGKVTRRFERKEAVTRKFWFIKHTFKPMVVFLSYRLNVPVINNTIRNGFAYLPNEGINTLPIFKEYRVRTFYGVHFSSELAFTKQMQNGNMWRISYFWDAYAAGKQYDRIEVAHHILEFSLLFHLNKNKQP